MPTCSTTTSSALWSDDYSRVLNESTVFNMLFQNFRTSASMQSTRLRGLDCEGLPVALELFRSVSSIMASPRR